MVEDLAEKAILRKLLVKINSDFRSQPPFEGELTFTIKTKILSRKRGSLTLSVLVTFLGTLYVGIAQFDDFIKGVNRIRSVCKSVLHEKLSLEASRAGVSSDDFLIDVEVTELYYRDTTISEENSYLDKINTDNSKINVYSEWNDSGHLKYARANSFEDLSNDKKYW